MKHFIIFAAIVSGVVSCEKYCNTTKDCSEDECCVTPRLSLVFGGPNVCQKLARERESCALVEAAASDEDEWNYYRSCPCADGLECIPTARVNMFLFEITILPYCVPLPTTEEPDLDGTDRGNNTLEETSNSSPESVTTPTSNPGNLLTPADNSNNSSTPINNSSLSPMVNP